MLRERAESGAGRARHIGRFLMLRRFAAVAAVAVAAFATWSVTAEEKECSECLKEGDKVAAFHVLDVTGPSKGEKVCYRCKYSSNAVAAVFTRCMCDETQKLVKKIDGEVAAKGIKGFLTHLSDDEEGSKKALTEVAEKHGIKMPLTVFENKVGPLSYKLAKDADVIVMVWKDGKVVETHAFKATDINDAKIAACVKAVEKVSAGG
jgi:hypothetical protein